MTKHTSLPGFRDFYPDEMARRNQIFAAWRDVARRYGFEEYDGPPLESLDLFIEKSGPEIAHQLFNFTDKGGREVALRPEMTPTFVRMLGAKIKGLPRPVRWFSTPQLFRYEKQQRGRLREHFQLNMDIVGETSVLADADLLAAALDVLRTLGLSASDVVARYSDRRLLHHALADLGVADEKMDVAYNVIDKVERDPREVCLRRLEEIGLTRGNANAAIDLTARSLEEILARYGSNPRFETVLADLNRYRAALASLGFGDFIQFDMKIVRGLAYYTGIVFEIFDRKGELRAICGGGRYDKLFSALAGIDIPALGFGFGDVVLGELLKERGIARPAAGESDFVVLAVDEGSESAALQIVSRLRSAGRSVIFPFVVGSVGKSLKAAAAAGARRAIVVGPREIAEGSFSVRDLRSSVQEKRSIDELLTLSS